VSARPALPTLPRARLLAGLAAALALAGCGSPDDTAAGGGAPTQVAAQVGGSEISIHQINQVLARAQVDTSTREVAQAASRQVLERLIDQQLAIDQAMERQLHRTPEVVAQLEAARREVIAQAFARQVATTAARPTPEEVRAYYAAHPALFAERRIYNLQELQIPGGAALVPELQRLAQQGRPMEEVVALLRARERPFTGSAATRAAEQLPLQLLPNLHALPAGQALVVQIGDNVTFVRVAAVQRAPLTEAQAGPRIEQYLANQRAAEAVRAEIARLRETVPIVYKGEFTPPAAATAASAAEAAAAPAAEAPAAAAPTAAAPGGAPPAADAVIERGLQGLR
jgi:EpsD family peptidyl-prolyl cis-trans isomerase